MNSFATVATKNRKDDFSGFHTADGYVVSDGYKRVTCAANDIYSQYIRFGDIFFQQMNNEMIRFSFVINKCSDDMNASCIMIGLYGVEDQSTFWICNDGSTCLEYTKSSNINDYYTEDYLENLDAQNNEIKCKFTSGDIVCIIVDCLAGNVWVKINDEHIKQYVWATKYIDSFQFILNMTKQNDSVSIIESYKTIVNQNEEKDKIISNLRNELQNMRNAKDYGIYGASNANLRSKNIELKKVNETLIIQNKMLKKELKDLREKYHIIELQNNSFKKNMKQMNDIQNKDEENVLLEYKDAKTLNVQNKEMYLSEKEFYKVFGIKKSEFSKLKPWKQKQLKKSKGLF